MFKLCTFPIVVLKGMVNRLGQESVTGWGMSEYLTGGVVRVFYEWMHLDCFAVRWLFVINSS